MQHGRTLERLDVFKTKQQQQQMMQQQEQLQIRDLHKESLDQILSLEERIRQLEMQEYKVAEVQMPPPTSKVKSLTDRQKSGSRSGGGGGGMVSSRSAGESRKREEVTVFCLF